MKRKIVKLGPSTLVVSLPSKWIKKYNLNAGDEIDLTEQDSTLQIKVSEEAQKQSVVLDLSKYDALLKRIFVSRYLRGYDEIEVKFDSLEKSRIIQRRTDELIGMEVVSQSKESLVVKDLGNVSGETFDSIIKRIFFILGSLSEESLNSIKKRETELEYLEDLEKNLNKFTDYCFRILNKQGYADHKKTAVLYCVLFLLEELGDQYKKIVSYIRENKIRLSTDIINIYDRINNYYKSLESLYLKFSFDDAILLAAERDRLIGFIDEKLKTTKSNHEIILLRGLEDVIETIVKIMGQLLNIN